MASLVMVPRRSHERGQANHGWLQTSHTFSFGKYQDQKHQKYGPLRVINEDTIAPNHGFGEHTHHEYEIFTYVVDGELEHKDSMGNTEILSRGSIQLTSTGSGVSHSEQTHGSSPVHFLQIWAQPFNSSSSPSSSPLSISSRSPSPCRTSQHLHAPKYYTRHFTDAEKTNNFCRVVAPEWEHGISRDRSLKEGSKSGPAPIKSDLTMYASLVEKGHKVKRELSGRKAYLHVVQRRRRGQDAGEEGAKVRVWGTHGFEELVLEEGDGVYVALIALRRGPGSDRGEIWVENVSEGEEVAEVLLFDME